MKKVKRIVRGMVKFYKSIRKDSVPIYCGDVIVDYGISRNGGVL